MVLKVAHADYQNYSKFNEEKIKDFISATFECDEFKKEVDINKRTFCCLKSLFIFNTIQCFISQLYVFDNKLIINLLIFTAKCPQ